jgi:hypothetical protein
MTRVAIDPWPDDPDDPADDGNAFARVWHAVLIVLAQVGVGLVVWVVWVVAVLLLYWLL